VTICHSATGNTEKPVSSVNISAMEENKENKSQAIIEVIDLGPLKVTGNFLLKDLQRNKEDSPGEVLLCRCGKSANKPFCDESHKK
jgi:CDGSH iron-sulfur domain-containing protein 3